MEGDKEEPPKQLVYSVILASKYEAMLEKEIRANKKGKSRKLTNQDRQIIQDIMREGIEKFRLYAHNEAQHMLRQMRFMEAEAERAEMQKILGGEAEKILEEAEKLSQNQKVAEEVALSSLSESSSSLNSQSTSEKSE
jgi:hypothetical protein